MNFLIRVVAGLVLGVSSTALLSYPTLALDATVGDNTTCAKWLRDRGELSAWVKGHAANTPMPTSTHVEGAWLIGFLQGYSWGCLKDKPLADGLDTGAVFERLDRICKARPDGPLSIVALDLVKELDPQHSDICLN
jgi:hypothetical protein